MFKYTQLIITILMIFLILPYQSNIELNFFNSPYMFTPIFLVTPLFFISFGIFIFSDYLNKYFKLLVLTLKTFILGSLPSLYYKITYLKVNHLDYLDLNFIRIHYLYSYEERLSYMLELLNSNGLNYLNYPNFTDIISAYALKYSKLEDLREASKILIDQFLNKSIEIPQKTYFDMFYTFITQPNVIPAICFLTGLCAAHFCFEYKFNRVHENVTSQLNENALKQDTFKEEILKEIEVSKRSTINNVDKATTSQLKEFQKCFNKHFEDVTGKMHADTAVTMSRCSLLSERFNTLNSRVNNAEAVFHKVIQTQNSNDLTKSLTDHSVIKNLQKSYTELEGKLDSRVAPAINTLQSSNNQLLDRVESVETNIEKINSIVSKFSGVN